MKTAIHKKERGGIEYVWMTNKCNSAGITKKDRNKRDNKSGRRERRQRSNERSWCLLAHETGMDGIVKSSQPAMATSHGKSKQASSSPSRQCYLLPPAPVPGVHKPRPATAKPALFDEEGCSGLGPGRKVSLRRVLHVLHVLIARMSAEDRYSREGRLGHYAQEPTILHSSGQHEFVPWPPASKVP